MKKEKAPEEISTNFLNHLFEFNYFSSFDDFKAHIFLLKNYFEIKRSSSPEIGERVVILSDKVIIHGDNNLTLGIPRSKNNKKIAYLDFGNSDDLKKSIVLFEDDFGTIYEICFTKNKIIISKEKKYTTIIDPVVPKVKEGTAIRFKRLEDFHDVLRAIESFNFEMNRFSKSENLSQEDLSNFFDISIEVVDSLGKILIKMGIQIRDMIFTYESHRDEKYKALLNDCANKTKITIRKNSFLNGRINYQKEEVALINELVKLMKEIIRKYIEKFIEQA